MTAYPLVVPLCIAKGVTGAPTLIPGSTVPANEEWEIKSVVFSNKSTAAPAFVTLILGNTAVAADGAVRLPGERLEPESAIEIEVGTPVGEGCRWFWRASHADVDVSLTAKKRYVDLDVVAP